MTTGSSPLLGLAIPVTGELSGTWGDTINNSITSLVDSAVAGTTTLSTDADVTLTTTALAANQARQAILLCTGARTAQRTITAPAQSKNYVVINATTGGYAVKLVGAGPTTGVTIAAGDAAVVAWNGADFQIIGLTKDSAQTLTNKTIAYASNTLTGVQPTLVSGTSIKTVNSTSLLGSGNVAVQPVLVSGTNIKTVGGTSLLGSGDVPVGTGDVTGPASSVDSELALFSGTGGKTLKRATTTGLLKGTSGVLSAASAGTDYVTPTGSETLTNKTIEAGTFTNGYTEETVTANTSTAYTIDLANGTVQILTLTGNCVYTFPTATAGRSFLLVQKQDATGSRTVTWPASVKWPASTAPTLTSTASKADVFAFTCDGTNWFGRVIGVNYL